MAGFRGASRLAVAVVVAALALGADAAERAYCAAYFDQPDGTYIGGSCSVPASPVGIVSGSTFTVGTAFEASAPDMVWTGIASCRASGETTASTAAYRATVPGGLAIHAARFDLIPAPLMSTDGFDPSFLLTTATPWANVTGFFTGDGSAACDSTPGTCSWSDNYGASGSAVFASPYRLRDFIDAAGGDYRTNIYYLPATAIQAYYPLAAMADLSNASYRAWRVAEAQRGIAAGAYDMVMLNQKFCQWNFGNENWLGGDLWTGCGESGAVVTTVSLLQAAGADLWTAEPDGFGYTDWIQGWHAMAQDLSAAGVPFAVYLDTPKLLRTDLYDDPSTGDVNEAALIRDVVENYADLVVLDRDGGGRRHSLAEENRLRALGVNVLVVDGACGQWGQSIAWGDHRRAYRPEASAMPGPNR